MCGGSAPEAPDPYDTAAAQSQFSKEAAQYGAMLNAVDQYTPYGSTTFQRRADGTPASQTVTLSPQVQAMLDAQFGAGTALNQAAAKQLSFLPQDKFTLPDSPDARGYSSQAFGEEVLDPSRFADPLSGEMFKSSGVDLTPAADTASIAQTFYDQGKARLQPDLDAARKAKDIELAQRGIPVGSEIYRDEMDRLDRSANNAFSDISRQAQLAAGEEQSRQFGQNLSTAQYGGAEQARLQESDLANRGFLGTTQNQQYNQLLSALGFGQNQYQTNLGNELLERNQPISEYAALSGATPQFQSPNLINTSSQNVAAPDYAGLVTNKYNQDVAAYNNQQAGLAGTIGKIGGAAATAIFSDEEAKEGREAADGEQILALFRDMPVDDYRYKEEAREAYDLPARRTGPMAQDWAAAFGGDGRTIDSSDAIGKLMAAMKALDARTMETA